MLAKQSGEITEFCRISGEQVRTGMFLEKILGMADNLEYGIKGFARSTEKLECWDEKELLMSFYKEIKSCFEELHVVAVEAEGTYFDPYVHYAMLEEKIDGVDANVVTDEIQKGYFCGTRLFRPAKVKVSK